jgi:hypothetical protein
MNLPDQSGDEHSGAGHVSPEAARDQPPKGFLYAAAMDEDSG